MEPKKILSAIIISVSITAIGAAAKSYVDVERLKVKVNTLFDLVKETRDDVKEVKLYLLKKEK